MPSDEELAALIPPWPKDAELKTYTGGCHCRRYRFRFTHPVFDEGQYAVAVCNCSFCSVHGKMNIYGPEGKFEFLSGNIEDLTLYQYRARVIKHYFCPTCCVNFLTKAFGHAIVNARTLDGVDPAKLQVRHVDLKDA